MNQYEILFSYHFSTLSRLMQAAAQVDEEAYFATSGYGKGSLHQLFFHVLVADRSWRSGLETGERNSGIDVEDYADREALTKLVVEEREAWLAYLAALDDAITKSEISLKSRVGGELRLPRWWILQHVAFHGMQHFAEIAQRLTELGHSPGNIDFIYYSPDEE